MNTTCSLCAELSGETNTRLSIALSDPMVFNAIIMASDDFAIIPSIGPLVVGHSLIVPFKHECSVFGSTPYSSFGQVLNLVERFGQFIHKILNPDYDIFCFEHGSYEGFPDRELCSTAHAHLHLLPISREVVREIGTVVTGISCSFDNPINIRNAIMALDEYILYFSSNGHCAVSNATIIDASAVPSQFMRQVVASQLGTKEWDWKINPNPPVLRETLKVMFTGYYENCFQTIGLNRALKHVVT